MAANLRTVAERSAVDGDVSVRLRKLASSNGERLEVAAGDARVRLDALELESLTWQDPSFFTVTLGVPGRAELAVTPDEVSSEDAIQVGNEFTLVQLQATSDGRVLLASPKLGYATHLGARELAALARRDQSFFSRLLETPLGPEPDPPLGPAH